MVVGTGDFGSSFLLTLGASLAKTIEGDLATWDIELEEELDCEASWKLLALVGGSDSN